MLLTIISQILEFFKNIQKNVEKKKLRNGGATWRCFSTTSDWTRKACAFTMRVTDAARGCIAESCLCFAVAWERLRGARQARREDGNRKPTTEPSIRRIQSSSSNLICVSVASSSCVTAASTPRMTSELARNAHGKKSKKIIEKLFLYRSVIGMIWNIKNEDIFVKKIPKKSFCIIRLSEW